MSELIGKVQGEYKNILNQTANIIADFELNSVVQNCPTTAADCKNYATNHYNLNVIIRLAIG